MEWQPQGNSRELCTELLLWELSTPIVTSPAASNLTAATLVVFSNGYKSATGSEKATNTIQAGQQALLEDIHR